MASSPFFEPTSQNISLCVAAGSLLYLWIAHSLRWKRYKAIHQKYGTKFREGGLTVQDAQEIMQVSGMWDMPELLKFALSYANVKTYAIPSISKLLYSTKQLSTVEHASKRYADTGILTYTWVSCPISGRLATPDGGEQSDPRSMIALGRVNWLHSKYRIANDEFLYTLALFILEYLRWTDKYGWRRLSEMEKQAVFIFWSEIGRQMKIRDIPETLDDLRYWVNEYELGHRREAQSNRDIIKFTNEYNSMVFPRIFGIRAIYEGILYCILEEPVRIAMMSPRQPWYMYAITNCVLYGLKYYQRHLALPNRRPFSMVPVELPTGPEVRMHPTVFEAKPWYKAQGGGLTWLVDYLSVWVGRREGLPGPQYRSEGYRLEEIGPLAYEHSGHEEVMKDAAELYGCPIRAPWNMTSSAKT